MSHFDDPRERKGLALLCFDGGGVRGLSSLYILKQVMETINVQNPPKPCDYFDMIGGTSTGGLIGIMLGRLRMSVDECIEAYKIMSPKIFTKVHHRLNLKGKVQGRFDHVAIEKSVKELLRNRGLREDELLRNTSPSSCKTFVCATSKQTGSTVILSSYSSERRGRDLFDVTTIWQAARATSAATSFFEPIVIGNEEFIDGATPANNPIMELWSEAYDVFPNSTDSNWVLDENVACVVSIGTGVPAMKPFGDDPLQIGAKLVKIATDTEKNAENFARHHPQLCVQGRYFRFNVNRGLEGIGLEDESRLNDIISATRFYLQSEEIYRLRVLCAGRLSKREFLARSYVFAYKASERSDVRALRASSERLGSLLDVRPNSDLLAWFTNTNNYKNWVAAEGGCLYYPTSSQTVDGFGRDLIVALPASWKMHLSFPKGRLLDVRVAFADCRNINPCGVEDVLRLLVSQTIIMFYPNQYLWQSLLEGVSPIERRSFGRDFKTAPPNTLYNILNLLLVSTKGMLGSYTGLKLLYVISNIHFLKGHDTAHRIVQLRAELERMHVHVLITGEDKLSCDNGSWGANDFPRVDEETEYQECLQSLKFDDIFTRRNQVAVAFDGTTQWIRSHPAFVEWIQGTSGILWIQGKPGSGKSVLAKSIVSLNSSLTDSVMASWFYSKRGGPVGMSHSSMMRSICYQLLKQRKAMFKAYQKIYRQEAFDERAFTNTMEVFATENDLPPVFCLLDGLDESAERDEKSGMEILNLFANLTEKPGSRLKIIILSRPYRSIEQVYGTYDILLEAENSADIANIVDRGLAYITATLARSEPESLSAFAKKRRGHLEGSSCSPEDLPKSPDATAQEREVAAIRSYLLTNARGVALWVTLSIDHATRHVQRGPITWTSLRKILTSLPLELFEMYSVITTDLAYDCNPEHIRIGRKILAWVITASNKRPLLVKELFDAMSIPDSWPVSTEEYPLTDFIRNNRPVSNSWPKFCRSIHDICGPLIEFVNPSQSGSFQYDRMSKVTGRSVIQLVHQTAKEFLEVGQENIFAFKPSEVENTVHAEAGLYLRMVIPLGTTPYTPLLTDVSENWKSTVVDTLMYLDDKFLLPFILCHFPVNEEYVNMAISSSDSQWMLSAFYYTMSYRNIDVAGVLEETVVGWCFIVACRLGLQTAIDNLLYLSALRPGWWAIHLEAVLGAALQVAQAYHITELVRLIRNHREVFSQPALQKNSKFDSPDILINASRRSRRPQAIHPGINYTDSNSRSQRPAPTFHCNASRSSVKEAISRILHYLAGNMQPLGMQAGISWTLGNSASGLDIDETSPKDTTTPDLSRLHLSTTSSDTSSGNARMSHQRRTFMG